MKLHDRRSQKQHETTAANLAFRESSAIGGPIAGATTLASSKDSFLPALQPAQAADHIVEAGKVRARFRVDIEQHFQ